MRMVANPDCSMRRQKIAPKASDSPLTYSTESQLSQPTKKIAGTLSVVLLGRVMMVRILWPFALVTQSYCATAFLNRSRGGVVAFCVCADTSAGARQKRNAAESRCFSCIGTGLLGDALCQQTARV